MVNFRTDQTTKKFQDWKDNQKEEDACVLCKKTSLQDFQHWRLVNNDFPYDKIAEVHHFLIPKRHVIEENLNEEELQEFKYIKSGFVEDKYDMLLEVTMKRRSVPAHHHVHLIVEKN